MNKFKKLEQGYPQYSQGEINPAYELEDRSVVGYCKDTREWLKWSPSGELNSSFGRTRREAANLGEE